ncbi:MAG: hypothetical protein CR968_04755 [Flavobacteriia bacterium]|nr:MAG: hypothetical protein CR968_04755 [Flavobacteriia bacterium]
MAKHKYFGTIKEDWAGFSAEITFNLFRDSNVSIFLGEECDEDGEDIDTPPNHEDLNDYAQTYSEFLLNFNHVLERIKEDAFKRYLNLYAHYYEDEHKSGQKPLNIDTKDKHFETITAIKYLRILKNGCVRIPMTYTLDQEHGLEVLIKNSEIIDIGGIAET